MRYESGKLTSDPRDADRSEAGVVDSFEGAEKKLSYRGEREVIRLAQKWLQSHAKEIE